MKLKTLVIGMDELLVSVRMKDFPNPLFSVSFEFRDLVISFRPWTRLFLDRISHLYEIIVFTSYDESLVQ